MKMFLLCVILLTIHDVSCGPFTSNLSDMHVEDLHIEKCNARSSSPVSVENIQIQIADKHIHLSGSFSTTEDLVAPIKASIEMQKKILFGWVHVPCDNNMGSCTFKDLCSYGYPENEPCPSEFARNGVPCRCPIEKGNYTMPPTSFEMWDDRSVLNGKYRGTITITHLAEEVACYNIKFVLNEMCLANLLNCW